MTCITVTIKAKINAESEDDAIDIITLILEDNNIEVKKIYTDSITQIEKERRKV